MSYWCLQISTSVSFADPTQGQAHTLQANNEHDKRQWLQCLRTVTKRGVKKAVATATVTRATSEDQSDTVSMLSVDLGSKGRYDLESVSDVNLLDGVKEGVKDILGVSLTSHGDESMCSVKDETDASSAALSSASSQMCIMSSHHPV